MDMSDNTIPRLTGANPTVSIIVPNYNYKRYLPLRLESIFGQEYTDFEVILLDDNSTDGSPAYLQEQASLHPEVSHCVLNKENTGNPFVQWEKGIALARGKYIWIAESDDYCDKSFLGKMVSLLEAHPDASYTLCGSHLVDSDNNPIQYNYDKWPMEEQSEGKAYQYSSATYLKHFLLWYNASYNASMIVFRRECLEKIQMDFSSMRYCGDWLFWIKMTEVGNVLILQERLNYFRRHQKSVTFISDGSEKQLTERLMIYFYLWEHHSFGPYRDALSRGYLYKEILKAKISEEKKKEYIGELRRFHVCRLHYALERIVKTLNQIFPWVSAPKFDYVSGIKSSQL